MSPDAGGGTDPWGRFDEALDLAGNRLDAARNRYESLTEMNAAPPAGYASALQEVEGDIDSLDSILDVTEADAAEAETVADRTKLLAEVFDAAWSFQTALLDVELDVYRTWHASLNDVAVDLDGATAELRSLTELTGDENYTQLRTGEQFTLQSLYRQLAIAEDDAMETLSAEEYVQRCLRTVEEYEEQFTADLKRLVDEDAPVKIKAERAVVTELVEQLEADVDSGALDGDATHDARSAVEGAMMVKYYTGYATHAYEYCQELADVCARIEGEPVPDEELIRSHAVDELRERVADAVVGATTKTDAERIVDLLREHDGSVDSALSTSELDEEEFFGAVQTAFEDGKITDMVVEFQ